MFQFHPIFIIAQLQDRAPFDLEVESVPPYCFPALHKRLRKRLMDKLTADVQRCNKTVVTPAVWFELSKS